MGFYAQVKRRGSPGRPPVIMLCSNCKFPTFFDFKDRQYPGVAYGNDVDALPADIGGLTAELRPP